MTREEIEALARELTDDDWRHIEKGSDWTGSDEVSGCTLGPKHFSALLAYVRELAAELTKSETKALMRTPGYEWQKRRLYERGLARFSEIAGCAEPTSLGRAVIRSIGGDQ